MIQTDLQLQVMTCNVCGDAEEIPRRMLRDQEQLLNMREHLEADHRECTEHKDNPTLARNCREFRKGIEQEEQRQTDRSRTCAGRRRAA